MIVFLKSYQPDDKLLNYLWSEISRRKRAELSHFKPFEDVGASKAFSTGLKKIQTISILSVETY